MEKYLSMLKSSNLFSGINENGILKLLSKTNFKVKRFFKNSRIFSVGEKIFGAAFVLRGSVMLQKEDYWGNISIIGKQKPGDVFGEAFAALNAESGVNAVAFEDCDILFFDLHPFFSAFNDKYSLQFVFLSNLFSHIAEKNIVLTSKINHMSKRTIRQKLLSYLSEQAEKNGSESFDIGFNRRQLSDFLSVDRSAMSKELCKMRDEGLLKFNKNHFVLIKKLTL